MKLISIDLVNFRQHAASRIEFGSGLTALCGSNGVGKSTVLEAITFAAYGEQRSDKDSIRFLWADSKKFSVTLTAEIDDRRYEIMRSNSDASLIDIDRSTGARKVLATSLKEVTPAVTKLFALTYDEFVNSFVAEQKALSFLDFKSVADRQRKVAKMVGFDRLRVAEDIAREKLKELRGKIEGLSAGLDDIDTLRLELASNESFLRGFKEELAQTEKEFSSLEDSRAPLKEKSDKAEKFKKLVLEMEGLGSTAETLSRALDAAKAEFDTATIAKNRRVEIEPKSKRYAEAQKERISLAAAKSEAERSNRMVRDLDQALATIESKKERRDAIKVFDQGQLEEELSVCSAAYESAVSEVDRIRNHWVEMRSRSAAEFAVARSELRQVVAMRENAQRRLDAGICPECGQPIGETIANSIAKFTEEEKIARERVVESEKAASSPEPVEIAASAEPLKELSDKKQVSFVKLKANPGKIADRETLSQEILDLEKRYRSLMAEFADLKVDYDASADERLLAEIKSLEDENAEHFRLAGSESRLERAETAVAKAKLEWLDAKTAYGKLKAERDELGFGEKRLEADALVEAAVRAFNDLLVELAIERERIGNLKNAVASTEKAVATSTRFVEEYLAREKELGSAKVTQLLYETVASEMKKLRIALNASIGPELAGRASEYLSLLTNGHYSVLDLDTNFNASIVDEGTVKAVISGGEEDIRDLSLRLALSELIQERSGRPMSLLILDEVFGSLDAERRQSVLDQLAALKSRFGQIFVISHIEGINEVADQCIWLSRDPVTKATVVSDSPLDLENVA